MLCGTTYVTKSSNKFLGNSFDNLVTASIKKGNGR